MARWKLTEKHYLSVKGVEWSRLKPFRKPASRFVIDIRFRSFDPEDQGS
jgi:hypothetical protein